MDANTIIRLLDAGYTKDEISALETVQVSTPAVETPAPAPVPAEAPAEVVAPVAEPAPAPQPTPTPEPAPAEEQPSMADVMRQIAKLTVAVQANAIANSVLPQGGFHQPSAEDALAEIIRPTFNERG